MSAMENFLSVRESKVVLLLGREDTFVKGIYSSPLSYRETNCSLTKYKGKMFHYKRRLKIVLVTATTARDTKTYKKIVELLLHHPNR